LSTLVVLAGLVIVRERQVHSSPRHPVLQRLWQHRLPCGEVGPQFGDGDGTSAGRHSSDELPCAEACDEGPGYDPATGPSAQALALISAAEAELANATSRSDLEARLAAVVSSANSLEFHNRDLVQGCASTMQSSFEFAEDALSGPCTQQQTQAAAKGAAITDAGSFAGAMVTGWVASLHGPVGWAALISTASAASIVASGTFLAVALSQC
jgi:hypothetical protein